MSSCANSGSAPTKNVSRVDPDVVEETETGYIKRLLKKQYIRIDDRHVKHPLIAQPIEFFREDDDYYYISVVKTLPEEAEAGCQVLFEAVVARANRAI